MIIAFLKTKQLDSLNYVLFKIIGNTSIAPFIFLKKVRKL